MWPVMNSSALIGGKFNLKKKHPLQDLLTSVNAVISTNERILFLKGHMNYNPNLRDDNHLKKPSVFATATSQLYVAIYGNLHLH